MGRTIETIICLLGRAGLGLVVEIDLSRVPEGTTDNCTFTVASQMREKLSTRARVETTGVFVSRVADSVDGNSGFVSIGAVNDRIVLVQTNLGSSFDPYNIYELDWEPGFGIPRGLINSTMDREWWYNLNDYVIQGICSAPAIQEISP